LKYFKFRGITLKKKPAESMRCWYFLSGRSVSDYIPSKRFLRRGKPINQTHLTYPEQIIPELRFQYCPMCRTPLVREAIFDDGIKREKCLQCGWIRSSTNGVGIVVIARDGTGIAVIFPPAEEGISLPAGMVEYGEHPSKAAVREVYEETGLEVEVVDCLGWGFISYRDWPGPVVMIMYEALITGGKLAGSEGGEARILPLEGLPVISARRKGSLMALDAYLKKRRIS
jgi:ADP-ribose pyrophosphatase YjhB (NUDIX family)